MCENATDKLTFFFNLDMMSMDDFIDGLILINKLGEDNVELTEKQ